MGSMVSGLTIQAANMAIQGFFLNKVASIKERGMWIPRIGNHDTNTPMAIPSAISCVVLWLLSNLTMSSRNFFGKYLSIGSKSKLSSIHLPRRRHAHGQAFILSPTHERRKGNHGAVIGAESGLRHITRKFQLITKTLRPSSQ